MRTFCTEGPVDPRYNYAVPRTGLLEVGLRKVDEWRYFTLFAPRQSGKTTYFQMLIHQIQAKRANICPIWITFEHYAAPPLDAFLRYFQSELVQETGVQAPTVPDFLELPTFFQNLAQALQKDIVLIIDEVEGLKQLEILNGFLHAIRSMYHKRERHHLRSVILVGVSNITGILQDSASPFNIADQINIPYFTFEETRGLLLQHTHETGQVFEDDVIAAIHDNAAGQPGLINAMARDLVENRCVGAAAITLEKFYQTLDAFLRVYVNKNIANVVNKAKQYPDIMKEILFNGPVSFSTYDDRISFLSTNGVITDEDGRCAIPVPVYKKCLYQTFKPRFINDDEVRYYKDPFVDEAVFLDQDGFLDMERLIDKYAAYVRQRGNIIFSEDKAKEGVYHYNLDVFLASYAGVFGGWVFPEVPEGGGRVDLLVLQGKKRWIIEVKRFLNLRGFESGKHQLAAYLRRSGLNTGYYVVFSDVHPEPSKTRETVDGSEILCWILPVKTPTPACL